MSETPDLLAALERSVEKAREARLADSRIARAAQVIYDELSGKYGDFNMPTGAAEALDAAGLLRRPEDPEVDIEITATGRTCVVKSSGQIIFNGVGREALTRTQSAVQHDAAVAARALRDAADEFDAADMRGVGQWLRADADRIEREGGASE